MKEVMFREEYIGEQDGFRVSKLHNLVSGRVTISKEPILPEDEYSRRKQHAIDVLSEIECRRMAREMKKEQNAV